MILQVGVKLILKNSDGAFLMLHRNVEKYPEVNALWDIVGGRIEPGSLLEDNLKREIVEEVGEIQYSTPRLISAQDIIKQPEKHIVRLTYTAEYKSGEIILSEEHDGFRWFSREDLLALGGELDRYIRSLLEQELL